MTAAYAVRSSTSTWQEQAIGALASTVRMFRAIVVAVWRISSASARITLKILRWIFKDADRYPAYMAQQPAVIIRHFPRVFFDYVVLPIMVACVLIVSGLAYTKYDNDQQAATEQSRKEAFQKEANETGAPTFHPPKHFGAVHYAPSRHRLGTRLAKK